MTKHYREEGGSCVLGKIVSFSELVKKDLSPKPNKAFYMTTKSKNLVVKKIGLEGLKNEARGCGMEVIYIMGDIIGPVKEELWL